MGHDPVDASCVKYVTEMTREQLDKCADIILAKYPVVDDISCVIDGSYALCRARPETLAKISTFKSQCGQFGGKFTPEHEQSYANATQWPFQYTNTINMYCDFTNDSDLGDFATANPQYTADNDGESAYAVMDLMHDTIYSYHK